MPMKQCPQCGKENPDEIRHCQACGARLFRPAERPCAKCGISNELGTRYCKGCGTALMPSVVSQRTPNSEHSKRFSGSQSNTPAMSSNDPEMPEWMTRFRLPKPTPPAPPSPQTEESVNLLMSLLRRILGIAPDEISSIQIRKKDGETIDLSTYPSESAKPKRKAKIQRQ